MGRSRYAVWIAVGDLVLTAGAYALAFLLRFGGFPEPNWEAFLEIFPFLLLATLFWLSLYNAYRDLHRSYIEVAGACVLSAVLVAVVAGLLVYLDTGARAFPRSIWTLGAILQAFFLSLWRVWFVSRAQRNFVQRPAIVVTHRSRNWSPDLPEYLRAARRMTPAQLMESRTVPPDALVFVDSDVSTRERQELLEWSVTNAIELYMIPSVYDVLLTGAYLTKLGDRPLLSVRPLSMQPEYRILKRFFDVFVAIVLLVLFSPFFLIIPIAIWLDSPGPVLYRQQRVGEGGRRFTILKFRTMVKDAERMTGPVWAHQNDPRVTRVGRILRATRLDELPQLFNVLKGDMSIVGPRPERPMFVEEFAKQDPHFRLRELVKPGLTGLAQVLGRYDTSPQDKLRYDLMYIGKYSLWLDFRILLWTVQVVLFPRLWAERLPLGVRQWSQSRQLSS